ncbi:hypothetical protein QUA00_05970 [Microcoleus sp. T2B6]|uniref:hypothetical protein n=1 Tax=Microcoleus sp. T2B6 TaxID=3055424 RepID=UPI002FD6D8DC
MENLDRLEARPTRVLLIFDTQFKCRTAYHPTYSQQLAPLCRTSDSTSSTSAGLVAGLPPIQDIDLQDLQDLPPNILGNCENTEKKQGEPESQNQDNQEKVEVKKVTPLSPASPANPIQDKDLSPASSPASSPANPPQSPATAQSKFRGEKLADQMREAIAKGSREDAKEVMERVAASGLQVRGFFAKAFTKEESLNIRLLRDFDLTKGTSVQYVGAKFAEQYKGVVLTVEGANAQNELCCSLPDSGGYTTWLKPEDLRKL